MVLLQAASATALAAVTATRCATFLIGAMVNETAGSFCQMRDSQQPVTSDRLPGGRRRRIATDTLLIRMTGWEWTSE
jgi:hypothetical protein